MKVLVVEDDEFKRRWIVEAASAALPSAEIFSARSVNGGLSAVLEFRPDILLLDMSLTTFDVGPEELGGRPQNFGGVEILRHLDRLKIELQTVVITQHERFERGSEEITIGTLAEEISRGMSLGSFTTIQLMNVGRHNSHGY